MRRFRLSIPALVALGVAAGCKSNDSSTAPDNNNATGQVEIRVADAPSAEFDNATIYVSQVALKGDTGEVIVSNTKTAFNLLTLQDGVTAVVGSGTVPTGSYGQVRLLVDSARVTLKAPLTFSDGSSSAKLTVPSGSESGLKIVITPAMNVISGQTVLVVDFDVSRSFVLTGPPDAPTGAMFKPVIHATAQDVAASISGTIAPASAKATVYAIVGLDTLATTVADSTTGTYMLRFLAPGGYFVAAHAPGFTDAVTAAIVLANGEAKTGVNLTLVAIP